jgi:hypothetical protein
MMTMDAQSPNRSSLGQQFRALARDARWRRLLLIVAILPALVAFSAEASLNFAMRESWDVLSGVLAYGVLVGGVALSSMLAGKFIATWPWRLVVFGWALTLVHLELYRASATPFWHYSRSGTIVLAYAFVSAEISAVAIWAMLGTLAWPARIPAASLLGIGVVYFYPLAPEYWSLLWIDALIAQFFGLLLVSAALRGAGYELRHVSDPLSEAAGTKSQFTIAHVFVWTTVIALLLGMFRIIGPPLLQIPGTWLPQIMAGGGFAVAGLAAFCATLGRGHWSLRLAAFVGVGIGAGLAAQLFEPSASLHWMLWTILAQCFLAALLLLWNGAGYRLLRTGKPLAARLST